jgi:hypothetical protein
MEPFRREPLADETEKDALFHGEVLAGEFKEAGEQGAGAQRVADGFEFAEQGTHFLVLAEHGLQSGANGRGHIAERAEQELVFLDGVSLEDRFQSGAALLEFAQAHGRQAALLVAHEGEDAAVFSKQEINETGAFVCG